MSVFHSIGLLIRALLRDRAELAVENLALRQQLAILKEMTKRPKLRPRDRVFGYGSPGSGRTGVQPFSWCSPTP